MDVNPFNDYYGGKMKKTGANRSDIKKIHALEKAGKDVVYIASALRIPIKTALSFMKVSDKPVEADADQRPDKATVTIPGLPKTTT